MHSLLKKVEKQEACLKMEKSKYIQTNSYIVSREKRKKNPEKKEVQILPWIVIVIQVYFRQHLNTYLLIYFIIMGLHEI